MIFALRKICVYLAPRIANIGLRVLALGSKFVLVIFLAKLLEPAELGIYGLFVATVGFSVLVIGGDYYTYSQRELLSNSRARWSFILQHHVVAMLVLYIVLLPAQLLIFYFNLLPKHLAIWFFILLIGEHLSQEINRLLIAMQRPLLASVVFFIRSGAWGFVLFPIMWLYKQFRTIEIVFALWTIGCITAILCGGILVWRESRPWKYWKLDTAWLKRGFSVGVTYLAATVCFKALLTVDRYTIELFAGADFLGVYVIYIGMAMTVVNILDPAVFSFLYPPLVRAYREGDYSVYRKLMRELTFSAVGLSFIIAVMIALLAPYVFEWISRPIYAEHLPILWLLLSMMMIYAVGMVPHYGLYAKGADKVIVFAHISSLMVFGAVIIALAKAMPFAATACALIAAFSWMGMVKYCCYISARRIEKSVPLSMLNQKS